MKSDGSPFNGWSLVLQPYIKSRGLFLCPSMPTEFEARGWCATTKNFNGQPITNHYSYNYLLGSDGSYGNPADLNDTYAWSPDGTIRWNRPRALGEVARPANVVMYQHSNSLQPYGYTWGCVYVTIETPDFINKLRMRVIHNDGDNLTFADGHTKWYQVKTASSDANTSGTGPSKDHYIWERTGIWMVPSFESGNGSSSLGYPAEPGK